MKTLQGEKDQEDFGKVTLIPTVDKGVLVADALGPRKVRVTRDMVLTKASCGRCPVTNIIPWWLGDYSRPTFTLPAQATTISGRCLTA